MVLRYFFCIFLFLLGSVLGGYAQETAVFTEAQRAYKRGNDFFEKGLLAKAKAAYQDAYDLLLPINEESSDYLRMKAELGVARSAVQLGHSDGEKRILDFIRTYQPDPLANEAIVEAGNYYYNAKDYEKAYSFYYLIDTYNLSKNQKSEVAFKKGYSLFVRKKFGAAKGEFLQIKDYQNQYYYPTNYYLGMCHFFEGRYDTALQSFDRVEKSMKYRNYVPYYKTQIYFSEGQYDKVLEYALPQLTISTVRNQKEIHHLIGQTYFEQGDYAKALPHLEHYASRTRKMRPEDFYQLGFVQHQAGNLRGASNNLQELTELDSPLGQNALYILADCYVQTGDKSSARSAFASASKMNYDPQIQKESLWNYAKLSYELKYDREAINALQTIPPNSPHYTEAQSIMSNIFLNTRDYAKAMETIEGIASKTPKLREAYQKVAYFRAVQAYKENSPLEAKTFLLKSLELPVDSRTKALANYWLGQIAYDARDYEESISKLNQFFLVANNSPNFPDESSIHTANYTMGYNYLKQEDYTTALTYFRNAVQGIDSNRSYIENEYVTNQLLGDAILRTGDCYFKNNQYDSAIQYYDAAVQQQYDGYVYALFQKAIIEGLRGNRTDKIIALEDIISKNPNSEFADDALYNLGLTYQEMAKYNEAVQPLNTLVSKYPSSPYFNDALISLGLITYNQGDFNRSIAYYKDVFKHNPDDQESQAALRALEEIYVEVLGKPDDYFRFLETIPGYQVDDQGKENISFRAAETQFENGNYERAIDGYAAYLRKYPSGLYSLQAHYNTAESYAVLRDFSKALVNYERVVQRGPSRYYPKALNKAALIAYNHAQDFGKSYEYYTLLEQVANTDELRFDAQIGALRSAYRTNNTPAVITMADKVRNNPQASKEQLAAANFYIGKIAFDTKDYATALSAFNEVIRNSDNEQTAEARYLVAYIYYEQRDLATAKQICINANKESSNYQFWVAKSVILLADILAEQNDLFNAKAALEAVIENFTEDQSLVDIAKTKLAQVNQRIEAESRIRETRPEDDLLMEESGG